MNLKKAIDSGLIRIVPSNRARAESLRKASLESLEVINQIPLTEKSSKIILRDLYECLRQHIEAEGFEKGYKSETHDSLKYIIDEVIKKHSLLKDFDKLRRLRNGINYYGDDINIETVKYYLKKVPEMIKQL